MASKYVAVFDLDGTLVDSFQQIYRTLLYTSKQTKLGEFPEWRVRNTFGLPLETMVTEGGVPPEKVLDFCRVFRANLESLVEIENPLFPGSIEVLSRFSEANIPMAIATSKPTWLAKKVVDNSELSLFSIMVIGTDSKPAKPDPAIVLEVLENYGVRKGIMFGDRIEDCIAGKRAGLLTCAITQSSHSKTDFAPLKPNFLYNSMEELAQDTLKIIEALEDTN